MQLYAVDQVSISAVRSESLKPGEGFEVSDNYARELLKKLPHTVSATKPAPKVTLPSVKVAFDRLASDLADAELAAGERLLEIKASITTARADADAEIETIKASVVTARTAADVEIEAITASVGTARINAGVEIDAINARVLAAKDAASLVGSEGQSNPAPKDNGGAGQKSEQAPANKAETPPKNKSGQ